MAETDVDSSGTPRRHSRVYGGGRAGGRSPAQHVEQGDYMHTEPYLTPDLSGDAASSQRGYHGEGAETTGNSVRGMLSGGLSGATTTRGGQQGGIGASAYDPEPAAYDGEQASDPADTSERDLTVGEQYGGVMEAPEGSINEATGPLP